MAKLIRHPKLPAAIVETPCRGNGYSYVVDVDTMGQMYLRGLGAPQGAEVGDVGTVQYTTGPNYGLYFWRSAS